MSSTAPLVRVRVPEPRDKWKSWAKLLQRVDTSRKDGYAFQGPWLRRGRLDELPAHGLVLLYDECGSRRHHAPRVQVVRVEPDGSLTPVSDEEGPLDAKGWDWALLLRDRVARLLRSGKPRPLAGVATEDLAEELACRQDAADAYVSALLVELSAGSHVALTAARHLLAAIPDIERGIAACERRIANGSAGDDAPAER
ncbi:hypothetical protein HRbin24_00093 [bacterium HR24]|nr:hypothetical protein HRbin24_00093 [bacterium HR24]